MYRPTECVFQMSLHERKSSVANDTNVRHACVNMSQECYVKLMGTWANGQLRKKHIVLYLSLAIFVGSELRVGGAVTPNRGTAIRFPGSDQKRRLTSWSSTSSPVASPEKGKHLTPLIFLLWTHPFCLFFLSFLSFVSFLSFTSLRHFLSSSPP